MNARALLTTALGLLLLSSSARAIDFCTREIDYHSVSISAGSVTIYIEDSPTETRCASGETRPGHRFAVVYEQNVNACYLNDVAPEWNADGLSGELHVPMASGCGLDVSFTIDTGTRQQGVGRDVDAVRAGAWLSTSGTGSAHGSYAVIGVVKRIPRSASARVDRAVGLSTFVVP